MYESEKSGTSGVRVWDWSFRFSDSDFQEKFKKKSKSGLRMVKFEKPECWRDRGLTICMNLRSLGDLGFEFQFSVFGFQLSFLFSDFVFFLIFVFRFRSQFFSVRI